MINRTGIVFMLINLTNPVWAATPIPDVWPQWLKDAMGTEGELTDGQQISMANARITLTAPSKLIEPVRAEEDLWYFSMDIGGQAPMECWASYEGVDPAAFTQGVADVNIQNVGTQQGGVNTQAVFDMGVGASGEAATLAVQWFYTVGKPPEAKAGLIKVKTAAIGDSTLSCSHNELGYRSTFDEAFEQIAQSTTIAADTTPFHEVLYLLSIQGTTVGYSRMSMLQDEDGDIEEYNVESMMFPVDATTITTTDSVRIGWSQPDGRMINQITTSADNGQLVTNLRLEPAEDGWQVSGMYQGKQLDAHIEQEQSIMSALGQTLAIQRMLKSGSASEAVFPSWVVEADPTAMTDVGINVNADRSGTLTMGPMTMQASFNEDGIVTNAVTSMAGTEIEMTLVWERGTPTPPQ